MTASLDEDPSGYECQLDSMIQEASRGTEKRRRKTSRDERSQKMGSRENIE